MRRFLFAFPVALFISYGLVIIMAWMVDLNTQELKSERQPMQFTIVTTDNQEPSQRKSRLLPEPPPLKPQPPQPPEIKPQLNPPITPALIAIPELHLNPAVSGIAISIPVSGQPQATPTPSAAQLAVDPAQNQQVMPLHRIEPVYPPKALQRRIEGHVVLSFDINESGRPVNIKIEEESPPRVFNREAMKALKRWKYQPMMINGQTQMRTTQRVKLEFKIR